MMSRSMAEGFKKKPWPQEIMFGRHLKELGIENVFQHPIDSYVIDFFVPHLNLCIEIDSTFKWGKERKDHAAKRDANLKKRGYSVLRINKARVKCLADTANILKSHNVI